MYTKQNFMDLWGPEGYLETFCGYKNRNGELDSKEKIWERIIKPFENNRHVCLEIGPGGGVWTNSLSLKFSEVYAIDVIPRSDKLNNSIKYFEVDSFDYSCSNIPDNSMDFVFSFGVFCHLPNSANDEYVKNVKRVLKPGGNAVLMFADWDTHPPLNEIEDRLEYKEKPHGFGWFYMDKNIIDGIMKKYDIEYEDMLPDFRDRIIHFTKA